MADLAVSEDFHQRTASASQIYYLRLPHVNHFMTLMQYLLLILVFVLLDLPSFALVYIYSLPKSQYAANALMPIFTTMAPNVQVFPSICAFEIMLALFRLFPS